MDPRVGLSIVVPAYNEEGRIGPTLEALLDFLARGLSPGEILVVDDGSRDGTAPLARRILGTAGAHRVLRNEENRGKGFAVRRGVLASRGERILFTDADLSTPIRQAERLLEGLAPQQPLEHLEVRVDDPNLVPVRAEAAGEEREGAVGGARDVSVGGVDEGDSQGAAPIRVLRKGILSRGE